MPLEFFYSPNTANTLSVFYRPGEDIRLGNSNSDSIFTFGDFRLYESNPLTLLTASTLNLSFGDFSTLESMNGVDLNPIKSNTVYPSELNLNPSNAFSYAYFGSFFTEVANSINNVISNFPYAILAYDNGVGVTIYDYNSDFNNTTGELSSSFKIPFSSLTNQGNVVVNSATTVGTFGLASDIDQFSIQMSSTTTSAQTKVFNIIGYSFSSDTIQYLEFAINGALEGITGQTSTLPIYIRPTKQRVANYEFSLSELEYNMLYGFKLNTLNVEDDRTEVENNFLWPRSIDGFNPDVFGNTFEAFKNSMLKSAADTDDAKTNILVKTVIPENYIELDSQQQIYASLVQTYAHEFDEIKRYIDGIAYAHTTTYNKIENVPDKFLKKLSNLLGWKLSDSFSELDLFEYLAGDADGNNNSFSHYNLEIWRRVLININWLYKKKGTRDAIQFIFKLLGAPECLLRFDEFVYKINSTSYNNTYANGDDSQELSTLKVNQNGYIKYISSDYIFQEGGAGRGNGQNYINQWRPEFDPIKNVDNVKVTVADEAVFGSEDTVNTKEIYLAIDPAQAIECDVFTFYQQSGTCWVWGSVAPPFSSLTIPFEYSVDCDVVQPDNITGMTFPQYLDYVYTNSINPRDRKVLGSTNTSFFYPSLRNAYLNYYMWSNPQSHRLTFHKLQPFLDLLEVNFSSYVKQLIPATTILEGEGTIIRNTIFNRQKFVYKPGLNDGSEFRTKLESIDPSLAVVYLSSDVNKQLNLNINNIVVGSEMVTIIASTMNQISYTAEVNINGFEADINANTISGRMRPSGVLTAPQQIPTTLVNPPNRFF